VFYALQHTLAGRGVHSGFVHLPLLPEQAAQWPGPALPSWPVGLQIAGVQQALALLVAHRQQGLGDVAWGDGALN
jgi:pyroglutamyl-peptidase